MKSSPLFLITLLCNFFLLQVQKSPPSKILTLTEYVQKEILLRVQWDLHYKYSSPSVRLNNTSEVLTALDSWLKKPNPEEPKFYAAERPLVQKNHETVKNLFFNMALLGGEESQYIYFDDAIPLRFFLKNQQPVLIVSGVVSQNIYNTIIVDSKTRPQKEISKNAIPRLDKIYSAIATTSIKYFGLSIIYGSKNFLTDDDLESEIVVIITSVASYAKYKNLEWTEDEWLKQAEIFFSARDNLTGIKKIALP